MLEARDQYKEALKARREDVASGLGAEATFLEVKPDYYADSRVLSEDALVVFNNLKDQFPPYGLVDKRGNPLTDLSEDRRSWTELAQALSKTGYYVFNKAEPRISECPYHEVLSRTLRGTTPPLEPIDNNEKGIDALRSYATPGAQLNAPLFSSLIARLPEIQKLHANITNPEEFARESVSLLREPLAHPQQWAGAFVYSLGNLTELLSSRFLNDELALKYTKVEKAPSGVERLAWAIPTEEFTIRQEVKVTDRTLGSEVDREGSHITIYPAGTRLKDIKVDEPLIGCPGDQLARAMWSRTIDVVVAEDLWSRVA